MSVTLPKPKALLFDWDNTLVNTWPTIHRALNHCLREMGHEEWSLEKVKSNVKKSMRDAFPQMFGDSWKDAADIYQTYYRQIHLEKLEALDGAKALLDWLATQPLYVALVSNKRGTNLRQESEHLGWNGYFSKLIGANDAEHDKPSPAPALLALEGSGIEASPEVWFIGDTVIDLECANNTGLTPILYGDVATSGGKLDGHAFAAHTPTHDDLKCLLQKHLV